MFLDSDKKSLYSIDTKEYAIENDSNFFSILKKETK